MRHIGFAPAGASVNAVCAKEKSTPPSRVKGYNVAFVTNIAWDADKQAVADLFGSFGPKFVRMFNDPATGRHKGFAHVHFDDEASVDKCAPSFACCACEL